MSFASKYSSWIPDRPADAASGMTRSIATRRTATASRVALDLPHPIQHFLQPRRRKLPPGQAAEFLDHLRVAHRAIVMADRIGQLRGLLLAALQRDRHPARQACRIALVELRILGDRDLLHQVERPPILESLRREDRVGVGAVDQHGGDHIGHAVVGGLAGGRLPFLRAAADLEPGEVIGEHLDLLDVVELDLRQQFEREERRPLGVKLAEEKLVVGLEQAEARRIDRKRADLLGADHRGQAVLERRRRAGHAFLSP